MVQSTAGLRQSVEHIERSKAISLSCPYVQVYESANIEGLDRGTGKSTSPHRAVFFSSPILASHPDANKLPPVNPSSDLRLPSLSNGSTAKSTPSYTSKFLSLNKYQEPSINKHKSEPSWSDIESVKQSIIENVLRNIGVDPQIDNSGISALQESKSTSLRTLRESAFGGQKIQNKQHNRHKGREEESEDEDLGGIKDGKNSQARLPTDKEFACPYHESNPDRPHHANEEEHLRRHHKVQASTVNEEALQRVFGKENLILVEKWGAIYFVLFPQANYGIDWSIDKFGSSNTWSSSPGIPRNLSSFADEVLPPTLDPLGIFLALTAKIRCMLQEEEKLHWDRIHTKLSEVVSETYLNL
ncbi:hypothetical protein Egran_01091 [Elaphomyces granulatus]|uniref:Uncharacterized protein n=1 Tax=Elaphomyces granulatus TaxID=519963 RepID=A0A232M481_9EURO|nr:hypothetical protein Egran_01091 [Elaphomyces granulatus]